MHLPYWSYTLAADFVSFGLQYRRAYSIYFLIASVVRSASLCSWPALWLDDVDWSSYCTTARRSLWERDKELGPKSSSFFEVFWEFVWRVLLLLLLLLLSLLMAWVLIICSLIIRSKLSSGLSNKIKTKSIVQKKMKMKNMDGMHFLSVSYKYLRTNTHSDKCT